MGICDLPWGSYFNVANSLDGSIFGIVHSLAYALCNMLFQKIVIHSICFFNVLFIYFDQTTVKNIHLLYILLTIVSHNVPQLLKPVFALHFVHAGNYKESMFKSSFITHIIHLCSCKRTHYLGKFSKYSKFTRLSDNVIKGICDFE